MSGVISKLSERRNVFLHPFSLRSHLFSCISQHCPGVKMAQSKLSRYRQWNSCPWSCPGFPSSEVCLKANSHHTNRQQQTLHWFLRCVVIRWLSALICVCWCSVNWPEAKLYIYFHPRFFSKCFWAYIKHPITYSICCCNINQLHFYLSQTNHVTFSFHWFLFTGVGLKQVIL